MRNKKFISDKLLVLGHRGSPKKEIENTIPSFSKALESGADGVELDVHLTKDGDIVVIHDFNTKRVFGVEAKVEDLTLSELKDISKDIPTLEEVFKEIGPVYYDIEIKAEMDFDPLLISNLTSILDSYPEIAQKVVVSSFNPWAMRKFSSLNKDKYPLGIIYEGAPTTVPLILRSGLGRILFPCDFLKPKWNIALRDGKRHPEYPIIPWCVDTKESFNEVIKVPKLNAIISNTPELIVSLIKETQEEC